MKTSKRILATVMAFLMAFTVLTVAFAADATSEAEANNDDTTATSFKIANGATGVLSDANDIDWYVYENDEDSVNRLTFTHDGQGTSATYFKVEVISSDAETVLASFTVKGDEKTTTSPDYITAAGKVYIKVSAGSNCTTYQYSLAVTDNTSNYSNDDEPNNEIAYAGAVTPTYTTAEAYNKGIISSSTDVDYYQFTAPKGYIKLNLKNGDGTKGSYKFTIIQLSNDAAPTELKIASMTLTADDTSLSSGSIGTNNSTYYIKVEGVSGSTGTYSFEIEAHNDNATEAEYNNIQGYANVLTNGMSYYGSLLSADDVDYYKINTTSTDSTSIKIVKATSAAATGDWNVEIYYNKQNSDTQKWEKVTVTTGTVTNDKAFEYSLAKLAARNYYVKITKGSNFTNQEYNISATKVAPDTSTDTTSTGFFASTWAAIKAMDWEPWWAQFKELMSNIDTLGTVYDLFRTSFGTIIKNWDYISESISKLF